MNKFIIAATAVGVLFVTLTVFSPVKRSILRGDRINILIVGVSEVDNVRHADVVKILSYEPVTGFFDIVSIPRDSMISVSGDVTWRRIQKLDEVFARIDRKHDNPDRVFEKFKLKVEDFLRGFEFHNYLEISYAAFTDFIDELGGIEMDILREMKYEDKSQDLYINFSTGRYLLNGENALKYVRYRDDVRGDIGRLKRQHAFINAVLNKIKSPEGALSFYRALRAANENIETDLGILDFSVIADEARNFNLQNYRVQKVPGEPVMRWGRSYWQADKRRLNDVMDVVKNSHLINLPAAKADTGKRVSTRVTAEVWNATGKSGLAREMTEYLRRRNVDVVRYGNYGVRRRHTQIISRTGDLKPAREVANIIGCRNIETNLDFSRMVDINVVIGEDINKVWEY